jgi:thioredoxin-related protein
MKHFLTILTFILWSYTTLASDSTIVFRKINYADLFEVAKKENKSVMLYFHFDGCGGCATMERTAFKDKNVFDYYNSTFINFEINTLKDEGIEINKLYKIKMHPTFLFLDNKGNELHKMAGVFSPEEFYKQANNALLSNKNFSNYKRLYNVGNRQPDFLFDYTYMLRDAYELDSTVVNEYLELTDKNDYKLEKNIKFIYEFSIHRFKIFIPYHNPRFNFILNNKELFYKYLDSNQVKTRIVWILLNTINKAIEENDEETFKQAIKSLKEYDNGEQYLFKEMDGRITGGITSKNLVLTSMLQYYEKIGDKSNYFKTLDTFTLKIWNDANELNNFAWNVYKQSNDIETEKIQTAIKCSLRSIELDNNYANNDTYAWLLYKSGKKKKALKQAKKTIDIAKKNNQDYSETQNLIDIITDKTTEIK